MAQEKVRIIFKKGNIAKIEGIGFSGGACDKALKPFEDALGKKKKETHKPEYFEKVTEKQKQPW